MRVEDGADRFLAPLKIGHENLDGAVRESLFDLPDRLGEDVRAKVGKVVAIDRGDHGVAEIHFANRVSHARRLADVVGRRPPVGHGAVGAVSRADVAEDHERRRAVLPALADVWAMRFLADRVEVEVAHQLLELEISWPAGCADLEPRRLPLRERFDSVAASDLVKRLAHSERRQW